MSDFIPIEQLLPAWPTARAELEPLVPELRDFLPAVVEACPQWAPIVPIWEELAALPAVAIGERFRDIRDNCREAGGWHKVSAYTWVKTKPLPPGAE